MKSIKEIKDSLSWEQSQDSRANVCISYLGQKTKPNLINETNIEDLTAYLKKRGIKGSTVNRYLASLSKILKYAYNRPSVYNMTRLPHIVWQEESKARLRFMTPDEEQTMIRLLGKSPYLSLFLFLLDTGVRLGEALSFKKDAIQRLDGKSFIVLYADETKNNTTRSVPLTRRCVSMLEKTGDFSHLNYNMAERVWTRLRKDMGLDGDKQFVIHCLRHTCASRLAQSGKVELHFIKEWLGHKSYNMTLRYAHLMPKNLLKAVTILEDYE